ncbi:MAG: methionyl-tRNA formyltransferase [Proteobacteria bacterium]|nr:methionyl-tRNA formyltransferase [Pseudomonadota bacterium]
MISLRLIFMGSPDFSVPVLEALIDAGHEVTCVYSRPPRPAGRGQKQKLSAVHAFAEAKGLPVRTPETLKDADVQAAFAALDADACIVVAYGLILPAAVINAPRLGCLNVHASLLPRWRGAAPIQRAILAGDTETGVSIMQIDDGLDTGDVLLTGKIPITPTTTAETLHDALAALGATLMRDALEGLAAGTLKATPQSDVGVTYATKLTRDEGRLDWRLPAVELERHVRALNPWPGVWFDHDGDRIKVLAAEIVDRQEDCGQPPGTLIDNALAVACGTGALRLLRVQRAGKDSQDGAAFVRGFPMPSGTDVG